MKDRDIFGKNEIIIDEKNNKYIDLCIGNGSIWLGHSNKKIIDSINKQLNKVWNDNGLQTKIQIKAKGIVEDFFPKTHYLAGFYSTGMEAAEFALRIAKGVTKKNNVIGFKKNTHGKSLATAFLGWENNDNIKLPFIHRFLLPQNISENKTLHLMEEKLSQKKISSVFVEPIQGAGGGVFASDNFYKNIFLLCKKYHILLVFDEILTGFYRTGPAFYFTPLGFTPDIILIGKALGNGFPVSGVVINKKYKITESMLSKSTYSGNPLAAAAVEATMQEIKTIKFNKIIPTLKGMIISTLNPLTKKGVKLSGKGAFWVLKLPHKINVKKIVHRINKKGVLVSSNKNYIRILPPVTINLKNLYQGCQIVKAEIIAAMES